MVATPTTDNVSNQAATRPRVTDLSLNTLGRITTAGLALVLVLLTGFTIWSSRTTRDAIVHATTSNELSDLYQQARAAVASEESLERKYRLEPSPEVAAKHHAAAEDLVRTLEMLKLRSDPSELPAIDAVLAAHRKYLDATSRMFAAVDAGDATRVLAIDNGEVDPLFSAIEDQVNATAVKHHEEAIQALHTLSTTESLAFSATPIVFGFGLLLLVLFWAILRALQQRLSVAHAREVQREIERIKSDAERDAALEANRAKSAFLATMSHELRTPLTAILGYSDLLLMQVEMMELPQLATDIGQIQIAGKHLLTLINDVLDLSKIESGKMQIYLEEINLRDLIYDVVATTEPLVAKNNNHLTLILEDTITRMYTDETKMRQVLLNLLGNAAKFTHQGEIVLRVEQQHRTDGDWIQFSVIDTGIGMTADEMKNLFQPFVQADSSTTRRYGGTGLGLALSKHLSELLGGSVTVESTPKVGSTFIATLPARLANQTNLALSPEPPPAEESSLDLIMQGHVTTVLVIDDDPQIREIISRHLTAQGIYVETASSGAEGLHLARTIYPNAITLDVLMPEMDGWEVLTACKSDPLLVDVPIIMVSIIDDKSKGFALGATDYLVKPIDNERLVRLIKQHDRSADDMPSNKTIMIIEDDEAARAMVSRLLSNAGWDVVEAATGPVALDWLATQSPALILLDLMLPELDGIQVLDRLHTLPYGPQIPIIVLTAKDLTADERTRLNASVAQILQKGEHDLSALLATVHSLVSRSG